MTPLRERNKVTVGIVGIVALNLALLGSFNLDKVTGGDTYAAHFAEAAGLKAGDEVRSAGVKVGKVTDVALDGDKVKVTFRAKDAELGRESTADIKLKTLLGRKFLMVTPKGPGKLSEDKPIPLAQTTTPYDVTEAFPGLANTVDAIDTDQLAESYRVLSDLFKDTPDEVRSNLRGLSRLSRTIASRDDQLAELLKRSRSVTQVLAARDQDLVAFMADANLLLEELRKRRAVIDQLLTNTTVLSEQLTALVRENRATLAPALARLRGVVQVLRKNEQNLDAAIPRLAVYARLQGNTLSTGRWFDTIATNFGTAATEGFQPGEFGPTPRGGSR